MSITIQRTTQTFCGDPRRVVARYHIPESGARTYAIIEKVRNMPEEAARISLHQTLRDFAGRHRNISRIFMNSFRAIEAHLSGKAGDLYLLSENKKLLIGAFLTSEYSIESAALYNPSLVEDPDQTGLQEGEKRVIACFRATGEGHISSLVFRGGVLDAGFHLCLSPEGRLVEEAEMVSTEEKANEGEYEIEFSLDTSISDRVIYPVSKDEQNGIEDARFVRFTHGNGTVEYFAPYTGCNGKTLTPKLISTTDFYRFKTVKLHGLEIKNRGMALFPRKINGKYALLARLDGINNYVIYSDKLNSWKGGIQIQEPQFPWEFVQVGNCGSPIETEFGWLVITHGVGPMRRYCIGAMLLDLNDPTKVINQLDEPLIVPNEAEREGYVPNVVYSCGSVIHNDRLIIPYGKSDTQSTYATVSVKELMSRLLPSDFAFSNQQKKSKGRILIVEDEVINQRVISTMLKQEGYEVEIASDGLIALMKIGKESYDVILSDISMPNLDGYRLLEYMKEHKIRVPVILLSGHTSQEDEARGLQMGAADYIRKPVERNLLLLRLEKIFKTIHNS